MREKYGFDVYAAGLYVHAEKAPWCKFTSAGKVYGQLMRGTFPRKMTMIFARDIGGDKLRENLHEQLKLAMTEAEWAQEKGNVEALLVAYKGGVKEDDALTLHSFGAKSIVLKNGKQVHSLTSAVLTRAFWATWFGKHPASASLKATAIVRYAPLRETYCKAPPKP